MDAAILRQLRMEGSREHPARADQDGVVVPAGKHLNASSNAADPRRTDENHLHGTARQGGSGVENHGAVLPSVRITLDIDIQRTEAGLRRVGHALRQEDAARTRTKDRFRVNKFVEDRVEAGAFEMLEERGGLPARENQPAKGSEFFRLSNELGRGTEFLKSLRVHVECALEGEDANLWNVGHSLRVAARFGAAQRYPCQS